VLTQMVEDTVMSVADAYYVAKVFNVSRREIDAETLHELYCTLGQDQRRTLAGLVLHNVERDPNRQIDVHELGSVLSNTVWEDAPMSLIIPMVMRECEVSLVMDPYHGVEYYRAVVATLTGTGTGAATVK
jgi:hypothetical protein